MRFLISALIWLGAAGLSGATMGTAKAADKVDLLLVLAADVSRSVDDYKFKLQRDGYAAALTTPAVVRAITSGEHGRIAVCLVEWSGAFAQSVVIGWTMVSGDAEARQLAGRIRQAPRPFRDRTAIGNALEFSAAQFDMAPFEGTRRVIDVSGDGTSNAGRDLLTARAEVLAKGITINGLVILSRQPLATNPNHTHPPGGLLAYYENNVIGGQGAFAYAAEGFDNFAASLTSKLIKEISSDTPPRRGASVALRTGSVVGAAALVWRRALVDRPSGWR